jgi:hypothetical protein
MTIGSTLRASPTASAIIELLAAPLSSFFYDGWVPNWREPTSGEVDGKC